MNDTGAARPVRVTARSIQIGLGVIWLIDGLLQLQPKMFGTSFANSVILPSAQGQPGFVSGPITHMAHLMSMQPVLTDIVFAGIQLLIGAGLLIRETVKPALVLSFVWALGSGRSARASGAFSPARRRHSRGRRGRRCSTWPSV